MKESYIENACIDLAKKSGFETRKVKFIASNGAPDRIFFKKDRFFWVEFKREKGGVLSELQIYHQNLLNNAGCEVHNIDSIEKFKEIIC